MSLGDRHWHSALPVPQDIVTAILGISTGIISWGGQVMPLDFEDWSGVSSVLQLSQAICTNAWAHRDLLLGEGPTYGDQNRLRLDVAEVLDELYLIPYACYPMQLHQTTIDFWCVGITVRSLRTLQMLT